jgi:Spy/CpxP family protein refolding chaperone
MHNLKYLALALLLVTLAITPAFAKQGQCDKARKKGEQQATRLEHLKERLDLTAQQEAEIKEILASTKVKNEALHREKRETREELREISRADTLDESRLRELVLKQSGQRADIMIAKHVTRTRINQVLTSEQQEQHEAFRQQKQERRGDAKHQQKRQ